MKVVIGWVIFINLVTRVVNEIENFEYKLQDLINDYNSRMRINNHDNDLDQRMKTNASTWFIQSMETMLTEIIEKLKDWQFNSQKNIDS